MTKNIDRRRQVVRQAAAAVYAPLGQSTPLRSTGRGEPRLQIASRNDRHQHTETEAHVSLANSMFRSGTMAPVLSLSCDGNGSHVSCNPLRWDGLSFQRRFFDQRRPVPRRCGASSSVCVGLRCVSVVLEPGASVKISSIDAGTTVYLSAATPVKTMAYDRGAFRMFGGSDPRHQHSDLCLKNLG
jgi:hypothetical protein